MPRSLLRQGRPLRQAPRTGRQDRSSTASGAPSPSRKSPARSRSRARCATPSPPGGSPTRTCFCGPRGTGKTTLGRLLAKAANCAAPADGEPCNKCDSCLAFIEGRAIDFVEQDAASHNSVDDIRQLRENVVLTPMAGERKVYLLDEVHMLSRRRPERAPEDAGGAAAAHHLRARHDRIAQGVRRRSSRAASASTSSASRWRRRSTRLRVICEKEGFSLDDESLEEIARAATGSLRDAINALEQVVTYYGKSPTLEQVREALGLSVDARSGQLARLALAGDLTGRRCELVAAGARRRRRHKAVHARSWSKYLRGLLLAKAGAAEALELPAEMAAEVKALADGHRARRRSSARCGTFGRHRLPGGRAVVAAAGAGARRVHLGVGGAAALAPRAAASPRHPNHSAHGAAAKAARRPQSRSRSRSSASRHRRDGRRSRARSTTGAVATGGRVRGAPPPRSQPSPRRRAAPAPPAISCSSVRAACKETDKKLAALLNGSCEVKSSEGDKLVLGFYHTFHLERDRDRALPRRSWRRRSRRRWAGR